MYTIFINDKVLYLTQNPPNFTVDSSLEYTSIHLGDCIDKFMDGPHRSLVINHGELKVLWKAFKKEFKVIHAAGGLVSNEKNEILWIYRHDTWDLPKGKVEKGEDRASAALREVKEECGVTELKLVCPMIKTYHVYYHKGRRILKITHWYKMEAHSDQELMAQTEEGITEVSWLDSVKMERAYENTYENIKLLCKFAAL